jgi:hypothetical protein
MSVPNDIVVSVIPSLSGEGLLPPGIHAARWDEVVRVFGSNARRKSLLLGLADALMDLAAADCRALWLDGSFVTSKEAPEDYDACWDPAGVDPAHLDPIFTDFTPSGRNARKSRYLGDIFVAGIEGRTGRPFVEFFQHTRDGAEKGIVLLDPRELR